MAGVETRLVGYVKLYRHLMEQPWSRTVGVILFFHLLIRANRESKVWHGKIIERGQFITSRAILTEMTGLSERQVRTAISILKRNELIVCETKKASSIPSSNPSSTKRTDASSFSSNGYTLITICNFDDYEGRRDNGVQPPVQPLSERASSLSSSISSITKEDKKKKTNNMPRASPPPTKCKPLKPKDIDY